MHQIVSCQTLPVNHKKKDMSDCEEVKTCKKKCLQKW